MTIENACTIPVFGRHRPGIWVEKDENRREGLGLCEPKALGKGKAGEEERREQPSLWARSAANGAEKTGRFRLLITT